jgi:ubiquinol-cytochrome c reductase iron-sulfur subunit
MNKAWRWLVAGIVLLLARRRPAPEADVEPPKDLGGELLATLFFLLAAICAGAFIAVYALDRLPAHTQLLGLSIGLAYAFLAAAVLTIGKRILPAEEDEEEYPPVDHEEEQAELTALVERSGERFTRRRLLKAAGGAAGTTLGLAILAPAVSLGPLFDVNPLYRTPWRRGTRLVDEAGRPLLAREIDLATFYTAYPEGADKEALASPLVVVRLEPASLRLPGGRDGWAPRGILAYSKICTHAGCAISLYRTPTFPPVEPKPALVCPCHYSTFDPASGGRVLFGPAGRPLPQLPLSIDGKGELRAAGNFSGPVGPSWWGVRMEHVK